MHDEREMTTHWFLAGLTEDLPPHDPAHRFYWAWSLGKEVRRLLGPVRKEIAQLEREGDMTSRDLCRAFDKAELSILALLHGLEE